MSIDPTTIVSDSKAVEDAQRVFDSLTVGHEELRGLRVDQVHLIDDLKPNEIELIDLHTKLKEIEVETAIIEAGDSIEDAASRNHGEGDIEEQIALLELELLEAKALYTLKSSIASAVTSVLPTLQAIHGSETDHGLGSRLLPLLAQRDALAMTTSKLGRQALELTLETSKVRKERLELANDNRSVAHEVLELAMQIKRKNARDIEDPELRHEATVLEKQLEVSSGRRRTLKSAISAIIAGSGLDWVSNERWRELVLDDAD